MEAHIATVVEKELNWWNFYFRKSWKAIILIPVIAFLYLEALAVTWSTIQLVVAIAQASIGVLLLIILTFLWMIFLTPTYCAWMVPCWVGTYWLQSKDKNPWERNIKIIIFILAGYFLPWWFLMGLYWIMAKLLG